MGGSGYRGKNGDDEKEEGRVSSVEEVERKVASSVSHSPPLSLSRSLSDPFL